MEREDTSLYTSLGIDVNNVDVLSLSDRDISSAYRKAALKHHPDKNRSDPSAADTFSAIFLAYETLQSPEKRAKYDAAIRAARLQNQRFQQLDKNRRRMKMDLDRREREAMGDVRKGKRNIDAETLKRMKQEIDRLRQEVARAQQEPLRNDRNRDERRKREKPTPVRSGSDAWSAAQSYDKFRNGVGTAAQFTTFEEAVLTGKNW